MQGHYLCSKRSVYTYPLSLMLIPADTIVGNGYDTDGVRRAIPSQSEVLV
jgi:hypothetical protein